MAYRPLTESVTGLEEEVLRTWDAEDTFRLSLEDRADAPDFVFFEGPPTANGRPGVHHILARTIKDLIARYRTMTGYRVARKAGWDTHGLPVELEAERALGISGKQQIEELGIAEFNRVCRDSVFTYQDDWENMSRRIGYWLDYDDPYVTYSNDFVESAWWALSEIDKKGLLYRGYRVVPYCPRCGTGLSSHEVAQGYQDVNEPAVFVKFHLVDDPDDARILSWTTTPWTLPGNLALAVGADIEYVRVRVLEDEPDEDGRLPRRDGPGSASPGEVLVLARSRLDAVMNHPYEIVGTVTGADLVGAAYEPLFPGAIDRGESAAAWTVLAGDFVSTEDGTGVVHTAVMYGEDDYRLGVAEGLPQQHTVDESGHFMPEVPGGLGGLHVKDKQTERAIRDWLVENDLLYHREMYEHSYPHCWRCASALLYMARHSWYIRTTAVKDRLLANSASVDWHPPEIGSGRMGEWLANNVDWALSRERYWGTPLPIWLCSEDDEHRVVLGSYAELADLAGDLGDDFDPHRPQIDEISWPCGVPGCEGRMHRIPEVADAWFDSGAMPFAQWHYPFENAEQFERHFPADYIAEGVDQTRGWFYSLLAISTILFESSPYRAVVVNDLILDAEGRKMSKSRGNIVDPWEAIGEYGADVIRFYLISGSNPWLPKRWDPSALQETERKLFSTLRHTYRFFALYANEEGWSHESGREVGPSTDLDRWVLGRLDRLTSGVRADLDEYDLTRAARRIQTFVLDDLSNWYVRRSRDRFWATGDDADPADTARAFSTLHECLTTVALLLAPFAPLLSDWLFRSLEDGASAHRADFPVSGDRFDAELDQAMEDARELAALGRAAREEAGVRTRQPLAAVHAVLPGGRRLPSALSELLAEELNVKQVVFLTDSGDLLRLSAKANFGVLGPKHGAETPAVARAIGELEGEILGRLREGATVEIAVGDRTVEIASDDVEILEHAQTELAMASSQGYLAALDTEVDEALRAEGLARELVNRVQRLRREAGLEVADRIHLVVTGTGPIEEAARTHGEYIAGETLAVSLNVGDDGRTDLTDVEIDDLTARIGVERVSG